MKGKHQIHRSIRIDAPPSSVWTVVADSTLLPEWVPMVHRVEHGAEGVGAVRRCEVDFGGRKGSMVERCVAFDAERRASYVVDEDTLGFNKMFADYGFSITLEPAGDGETAAHIDTYYTPRNAMSAVMNTLVARRKFAGTVETILGGLKALSEGGG